MTDAHIIAVDYVRWFIRETGAASPAEVYSGKYRGHHIEVHLEKDRCLTVDGGPDEIDCLVAWNEAKDLRRQPAHPDLTQKEMFA